MTDSDDFDFATLVEWLRPKRVVELGTGDGFNAARVMAVLPHKSYFTTINWPNPPSGDDPSRYLERWMSDPRLMLVYGDTRDQAWRFGDQTIDLLLIDSTHTRECAAAEWEAYRPKLTNGAIVVVDDLDHNDMRKFWDSLIYEKVEFRGGRLGVLQYVTE